MRKRWIQRIQQNKEHLTRQAAQQGAENPELKKKSRRLRQQLLLTVGAFLVVIALVSAATAAWYTNIAKTSTMTFQTAAWGISQDKIQVSKDVIQIAPGNSGELAFSVDNSDSSQALLTGVTVSKKNMDEEMQKRLYFYVDTDQRVEDAQGVETASKYYIGSEQNHGYTYTVAGGDWLEVSKESAAEALCWEWVYDLQGYYFRGTVSDTSVTEEEYVRPISYAWEDAVYESDQTAADYTGALVSIGDQTVDAFLTQWSQTDGYAGTIQTESKKIVNGHRYYPVSVDENGAGVWAYLCNYSEVQAGMTYDNQLAQAEEAVQVTADVCFTAANVPVAERMAYTEADLRAALADDTVTVICLGSDLTLEGVIDYGTAAAEAGSVTEANGSKILDLNGFAISWEEAAGVGPFVSIGSGAALTIRNGQLAAAEASSGTTQVQNVAAQVSEGGSLILGHVTISNCYIGVRLENGGQVKVLNSEIQGTGYGLICPDGVSTTVGTAYIYMQNSQLQGGVAGVLLEEATQEVLTQRVRLTVANSHISGTQAGLVQCRQASSASLSNSQVVGATGLILKGGSVQIKDSTILGNGAAQPAGSQESWTSTGDGILAEADRSAMATVVIRGSQTSISSQNGNGVQLYGVAGKGPGRILIYEGTIQGADGAALWNGLGTFEIYGGTFTSNGTEPVSASIKRYDQ